MVFLVLVDMGLSIVGAIVSVATVTAILADVSEPRARYARESDAEKSRDHR